MNHTNLAVSRRLAKAGWKDGAEQWWCGEGEAAIITDLPMEAIDGKTVAPARDLSELEAKIGEHDGYCEFSYFGHGDNGACARVTLPGATGEGFADHIISALGAAVAEALEAAAKEKPCKKQK